MKHIKTYKYRCDHCGGTGWIATERECKKCHKDAVPYDEEEECELRCEYCGHLVEDCTMIDNRYYYEYDD